MKLAKFGLCASFLNLAAVSAQARPLHVISYNVENLFDASHDDGKNDWTYLPLSFPNKKQKCRETSGGGFYLEECLTTNWDDQRFATKVKQTAKAVHAAMKFATGVDSTSPDFLAVVEIENSKAAEKLKSALGYDKVIVSNGPDKRGIDVALFFNDASDLQFESTKAHRVDLSDIGGKETREILEVKFARPTGNLHVFINHWPSPGNSAESRFIAAKVLRKVSDQRLAQDSKASILALGDFNTTNEEEANSGLSKHILGGGNQQTRLVDVDARVREEFTDLDLPDGTHYFGRDNSWSRLDRIFVSQNMSKPNGSGIKVDFSAYRICEAREIMMQNNGEWVPKRMRASDSSENSGFSDHLPIYVKLDLD